MSGVLELGSRWRATFLERHSGAPGLGTEREEEIAEVWCRNWLRGWKESRDRNMGWIPGPERWTGVVLENDCV